MNRPPALPLVLALAFCAARPACLLAEESPPPKVVTGSVLDEKGGPIAGATIWLVLRYAREIEVRVVSSVSDSEGKYRIEVEPQWANRASDYAPRTLWCYAPGFSLGTGSAKEQIDEDSAEPIALELAPETNVAFRVLDDRGQPAPGAKLGDLRYETKRNVISGPPKEFLEHVSLKSDRQGRVAIPFAEKSRLYSVQFVLPAFGEQSLDLSRAEGVADERTFQFRPTGSLALRVKGGAPSQRAGLGFYVSGEGNFGSSYATSNGKAVTDNSGEAGFDLIAEGAYRVSCQRDLDFDGLRPRLPDQVTVTKGQTTEVIVTLEPTVKVKGRVIAVGSDRPAADTEVYLNYGRSQHEIVTTNSEGWYEAEVLSGDVWANVGKLPPQFSDFSRIYTNQATKVEADAGTVQLPPLELRETVKVAGSVVDQDDKPLANFRVLASGGQASRGQAMTDSNGAFSLKLPKGEEISVYRVYSSDAGATRRFVAEVVSEEPLLLRVNTSGVPSNVTITTAPTPEGKLRAPAQPAASNGNQPKIIIAKNVIIADGKIVDLIGAQMYLESFKNLAALRPSVMMTQGLWPNQERYEEMQLWMEAMREITGVRMVSNFAGSQVSNRYDSLMPGDPWPPEGTRAVEGRVVTPEGKPAAGAQVVLIEPPSPEERWPSNHLYLSNGFLRSSDEQVLSYTDDTGVFQHHTPADAYGFFVFHAEGFAMAGADASGAGAVPIQLKRWARITARRPRDKQIKQHLSLQCQLKPSAVLAPVTLYAHSSRDATEHDFVAWPAGVKVSVQRNVQGDTGISTSIQGASARVQTKPGETVHVEFGPLTRAQRAEAQAHLKEWREMNR